MPPLVWRYRTALLYDRTSGRGMMLAEALDTVSHDQWTRLLPAAWAGHTLLELAVRPLFVWTRGYLMIDDTVLPKPVATAMEGVAWVFSSQAPMPVDGFAAVLVGWTHGPRRRPLGIRLWHQGGPST
jgi:hypothetical protein